MYKGLFTCLFLPEPGFGLISSGPLPVDGVVMVAPAKKEIESDNEINIHLYNMISRFPLLYAIRNITESQKDTTIVQSH